MSSPSRVSQVIHLIEERLSGAIDLQSRAYEIRQEAIALSNQSDALVAEAKKVENDSLLFAISELGDAQGRMAHSLVMSSMSQKLPQSFSPRDDAEKFDKYGVLVSSKNLEEADFIIEQAIQSKSSVVFDNPYASDRGKNAWRRILFENARESKAIPNVESSTSNMEIGKAGSFLDDFMDEDANIKEDPQELKSEDKNNLELKPISAIKSPDIPVIRTSKIPGFLKDV